MCNTLEEAMVLAVGHCKSRPSDSVWIYPADENTPLQPFFNNIGIIIGTDSICNRPFLYSEFHDNLSVETAADCERYAAEFKSIFAKDGLDDENIVYTLSSMSYFETHLNDDDFYVELYLSGDIERLSPIVEELNSLDKDAGGELVIDIQSKTLIGTIKTYPVKGGIFEKRRLKKSNEEIKKALMAIVEEATPYLED